MSKRLVNQPSAAPTRKVRSASAASALVMLAASLLNRLAGAGITVEEAGFAVTIAVFLAGYVIREEDSPRLTGT